MASVLDVVDGVAVVFVGSVVVAVVVVDGKVVVGVLVSLCLLLWSMLL